MLDIGVYNLFFLCQYFCQELSSYVAEIQISHSTMKHKSTENQATLPLVLTEVLLSRYPDVPGFISKHQ